MIQDIFITPQVFNEKNVSNDTTALVLIELLNNIKSTGNISGVSNNWYTQVKSNIETIEDKEVKNKLIILIEGLNKESIIIYTDYENIEEEQKWIQKAKDLEGSRDKRFDFIITCETFNDFPFKLLQCNSGESIEQDLLKFKKQCKKLLTYSEKVRLYDPYFDILHYYHRESKEFYKFQESLTIIDRMLNSFDSEGGTIIIHTLVSMEYLDKDNCKKFFNPSKEEKFKTYIKNVQEKLNKSRHKHQIEIYFWTASKNERYNFHDRYITTERFCVQVGNGLDITFKDSAWAIIGGRIRMDLRDKARFCVAKNLSKARYYRL